MPETSAPERPDRLARVDHLVLATPDLDDGIRYVRETCGVDPVPGGHHPVYGTRNALVSLGRGCYLEVIGPDRKVLQTEEVRIFGIHELEKPTLVTWAATGANLEALVEQARREMIDLGSVSQGSRRQPDGEELTWTFTDPLAARNGGLVPFFVDWGASPHPSESLPQACELLELELRHPHADNVQQRLAFLGFDLPVTPAETPGVGARIRCPKGIVRL